MFVEMLSYLNSKKMKILVVEKTDRLTRNMRDAVAVNNWIEDDDEKQIHFVKENFILTRNSKSNDKFIWGIKVTTAQYYLDNLSEEVKKGQKEKLRQGWLPTRAPYGYKTIGDQGHKIHVIDETVAPLIKKMFEMYASGKYSVFTLGKEVYKMGLRNTAGNKIQKSWLHRLLTDPFYIGFNVWKGQQTQGSQEPLIDMETFEKVQKVLKSKCTPKYSSHDYLFKGFFKCEECGGTITWEQKKGIMYGHCNHYRKCSVRKWSREETMSDYLIAEFAQFKITNPRLMEWLSRALKESNKNESDFYLDNVKQLEKQRELLKKRLDAIYVDKIDGKITEVYYNEKFKQFSTELTLVDQNITKHTTAVNLGQERRATIYDVAQGGKDKYEKSGIVERRQLVRDAFCNLKLEGDKIYYDLQEDYALVKSLAKQTNSSKLGKLIDSGDKIFEQHDLAVVSKYYATSEPECSVVLPLEDSDLGPIAYRNPQLSLGPGLSFHPEDKSGAGG
jgi:DNA invertase Pin-like site-specific DNA recombinase